MSTPRDLPAAITMVRGWINSAEARGPDQYGRHPIPVYGEALAEVLHHLEQAQAAQQTPSSCGDVDDEQRDRLLRVWSSGAQSSVASLLMSSAAGAGLPPSQAIGYARRHCAQILEDPIVREDITHELAHQWLGHARKQPRIVAVHYAHRPGQEQ